MTRDDHPQNEVFDEWNRKRDTLGLIAFALLLAIVVLLFGGMIQ